MKQQLYQILSTYNLGSTATHRSSLLGGISVCLEVSFDSAKNDLDEHPDKEFDCRVIGGPSELSRHYPSGDTYIQQLKGTAEVSVGGTIFSIFFFFPLLSLYRKSLWFEADS